MRTIAALIVVLLSIGQNTLSICTNNYGSAPCKFIPSSPGHAPPCAQPGLTYCEHPTYYPGQVIEQLIQNWQYDYSTLLSNETPEEFNSYFVPLVSRQIPTPVYGPPPPNSIHQYYQPGSIHTAKVQYNFPVNTYIPSLPNLHLNHTDGRPSHPPQVANNGYNYNIPFKSGTPSQEQYNNHPIFSLPQVEHTNNWWKRYTRDVSKQRRRRRSLIQTSSNDTDSGNRSKRQTQSGEQLCQIRTQYIMPRAALNNKGNWMYIVNMPEVDNKYTQLVKSETCGSQQCNSICGLPIGYSSRCEQKYAQKRLIALEGEGNQLYTDVFWFPSCCVCTITRNNEQ
ncbi:hypothetical protein FQR65_LT02492 [Abscondita terminalis]|nr:hypothetical protein FQR65_LT02492 [Abscondita terminalis]